MSTSNGQPASGTVQFEDRNRGFPWLPVIALVGVAAGAILLIKRYQSGESSGFSMENALDQCERAASQLHDRLMGYESEFLAG